MERTCRTIFFSCASALPACTSEGRVYIPCEKEALRSPLSAFPRSKISISGEQNVYERTWQYREVEKVRKTLKVEELSPVYLELKVAYCKRKGSGFHI